MPESVPISIMGQTFHLKGNHDPSYIARVEQYLNGKIDDVRKAGGPVDTGKLMILVALNLVDDYFAKEAEVDALMQTVNTRSQELINLLDSHITADV